MSGDPGSTYRRRRLRHAPRGIEPTSVARHGSTSSKHVFYDLSIRRASRCFRAASNSGSPSSASAHARAFYSQLDHNSPAASMVIVEPWAGTIASTLNHSELHHRNCALTRFDLIAARQRRATLKPHQTTWRSTRACQAFALRESGAFRGSVGSSDTGHGLFIDSAGLDIEPNTATFYVTHRLQHRIHDFSILGVPLSGKRFGKTLVDVHENNRSLFSNTSLFFYKFAGCL